MTDDDFTVPPDLIAFFRQLRALADDTIRQLERAGHHVEIVRTDSAGSSDSFVVSGQAALIGTTTITAAAEVLTPEVAAEQVEKARALLGGLIAAGAAAGAGAWKMAEHIAVIEGFIAFAERVFHLGGG